MSAQKAIITAFTGKIKQDKLDQRRTVLSDKDQAFVNGVGWLAEHWDIPLENSVAGIVEDKGKAEAEAKAESEDDTHSQRPDPKSTVAVLKDFMDDHGIDYSSDDLKADLNQKIDDWPASQ